MNNVNLIGRITKDIELRTTDSGLQCVAMFIAINNGKDKDGKDRPADFPKIYVYEKQAENLAKYCKKGSQIAITGRLKTRSWDKEDGNKGYETYVVANKIQFLDTKSSSENTIPEPDYVSSKEERDPFKEFGEEVVLTDADLPF